MSSITASITKDRSLMRPRRSAQAAGSWSSCISLWWTDRTNTGGMRSGAFPGEVIDNRYERTAFLSTFARYFEPLLFVRVDDGQKPNDLIVGRRRRVGEPAVDRPLVMHVLRMPLRRRHAPLRWLARLRFAWLSRAT